MPCQRPSKYASALRNGFKFAVRDGCLLAAHLLGIGVDQPMQIPRSTESVGNNIRGSDLPL